MDHIDGYRNLIHAIIHRAVLDTFLPPINKKQIDPLARSAMRFLFSKDIDSWLSLIDRDPVVFKRKLLDTMFAEKSEVDDSDRRAFRLNRIFYEKEMEQQSDARERLRIQYEWIE